MNEKAYYKRLLKNYEKNGALTDEAKCRRAANVYWKHTKLWKTATPEWREGFQIAATLASGLRLFYGGRFAHPCGDPDSMWNLKATAKTFRYFNFFVFDIPKHYGAAALRTYYRNLKINADYLAQFYGGRKEPVKEGLKGVAYAAKIFGVKLRAA